MAAASHVTPRSWHVTAGQRAGARQGRDSALFGEVLAVAPQLLAQQSIAQNHGFSPEVPGRWIPILGIALDNR